MHIRNILDTPDSDSLQEIFEQLAGNDKVKIERIISTGQATPKGEWLVQEKSEFVLLLAGKAGLEFKSGVEFDMLTGDHLLIPSGMEHRVKYTQEEPPTIWLAVHY